MLEIADQKSVKGLGYIGGVMGPKEFTDSKSYVVQMLCSGKHKISYVEPTLVYGNGRNDIVFSSYKLSVLCELFSYLQFSVVKDVVIRHIMQKSGS